MKKKWGKTSFDIKGDGFIEGNQLKAFGIDGILNKLTYQNYAYKNITFNTFGNGNEYSAEVEIDDSHLQLTANATTNWKSASKHIHLVAEVEQFRPHTLNLTTKHPNTNFSGDIHVGFTGKNIENLEGELCIENFRMESEKETYTQSPITFSIENEDEQKHLLFDSDFMSAEIDGTFNYTSLAGNAQMFMHQYLPNIISAPKIVSKKADELSVFVNIKDLSILEKVLELPLKMEKPGYVSTYFNSENNDLSFNASFPAIAYDQQKAKDVEVIIGQSNDSIECNVKINKEFGSTPVDIVVNATGLDDHIKTNINWSNKINDLYKGHVGINTFFTPNENYGRDISFVIDPSEVTLNDTLWNIHRSQIDITEEHIIVDNFKIENKSHHICVNGQVSDDINDSLHIDLKEINLEYLFDIINFKPVDFGGIATGKAYAVNLKKNAKIEGDVDVQDFTFNHAHLGDLDIIIGWGQEENAININAHIEDPKNNGITDVNGEVRLGAPPRGGLDLMINTQNIDLYFLNKYTKEIFTNMNGRASGWTRVFGPFKDI
ncbi:MAG: translocation/assembly module TamB, partial [Paraprevotella sp.]|nr:translocation/assembly module TamB [Paraprevotella sp.]